MPAFDLENKGQFSAFGSCQRKTIRTVNLFGKDYDVKVLAKTEDGNFLNARIDGVYFCLPPMEVSGHILSQSEEEIEKYILDKMTAKYSKRVVEFVKKHSGKFFRQFPSQSPEPVTLSLGRYKTQIIIGCMSLMPPMRGDVKISIPENGNLDLEKLIRENRFEDIPNFFEISK